MADVIRIAGDKWSYTDLKVLNQALRVLKIDSGLLTITPRADYATAWYAALIVHPANELEAAYLRQVVKRFAGLFIETGTPEWHDATPIKNCPSGV